MSIKLPEPNITPWMQSEPPKDGTWIVAIGAITFDGEDFGSFEPFTKLIRWVDDEDQACWLDTEDMELRTDSRECVRIDYWLPAP